VIVRFAATATAFAILLGCGGAEAPVSERLSEAFERRPAAGVLATATFEGDIEVDPRAATTETHGHVWHHVYYLDDALFDSMTCYGEATNCAVFDLASNDDGRTWTGSLAFEDATDRPLVLRYDLGRAGTFRTARSVTLEVFASPYGTVGTTTLRRVAHAEPTDALRARLRARGVLRQAYHLLAERYGDRQPDETRILTSRPQAPAPPPCHPVVVHEPQALAWLGLQAPATVSWAYGMEVDEAAGTLRLTARRDPACDGQLEEVTLRARLDEYGDLERVSETRDETEDAPP